MVAERTASDDEEARLSSLGTGGVTESAETPAVVASEASDADAAAAPGLVGGPVESPGEKGPVGDARHAQARRLTGAGDSPLDAPSPSSSNEPSPVAHAILSRRQAPRRGRSRSMPTPMMTTAEVDESIMNLQSGNSEGNGIAQPLAQLPPELTVHQLGPNGRSPKSGGAVSREEVLSIRHEYLGPGATQANLDEGVLKKVASYQKLQQARRHSVAVPGADDVDHLDLDQLGTDFTYDSVRRNSIASSGNSSRVSSARPQSDQSAPRILSDSIASVSTHGSNADIDEDEPIADTRRAEMERRRQRNNLTAAFKRPSAIDPEALQATSEVLKFAEKQASKIAGHEASFSDSEQPRTPGEEEEAEAGVTQDGDQGPLGGLAQGLDSRRDSLMLRLFGNSADVHHVEEDENFTPVRFNPKSEFRARWDVCVILAIVYNCIVLPVRIAFGDGKIGPLFIIDFIIDIFFIVDITINFQTGFDDGGQIVMNKRTVRDNYLYGWFTADCMASMPLGLLGIGGDDSIAGSDERAHLFLRLPRFLRLLRLPRLFRYLHRWEEQLNLDTSFLRMGKLIFMIILFSHINACTQYLASRLEGFPMDGWVVRTGMLDAEPVEQYSLAMFNALSHMLCIGYGGGPQHLAPSTNSEVWITIVSMMAGASFYVILVGMMSSILLSMDQSGALYTQTMDILKQYFQYRKVPKDMRDRVLRYYQHRWHTRKVFNEEKMLSEVSRCVRMDIKAYIAKKLLKKVPIFDLCAKPVVRAVAEVLQPLGFPPGEYVYTEGQIAEEMFFIAMGEVEIEGAGGEVMTTLMAGSYFGEFPLIFEDINTRTASACSLTYSELYSLARDDFERISAIYPELRDIMYQIAEARQERTAAVSSMAMTDLEAHEESGTESELSFVAARDGPNDVGFTPTAMKRYSHKARLTQTITPPPQSS
mmetsp:Transcript_15423/g.50692  ORF Transcript_15423/g.50692 Transcript_15423/m.50692 type:complete len:930 (-) Transcript_15423:50-2839(-)